MVVIHNNYCIKIPFFSRYGEEKMAKDVETLTTLSDELEKRCEAQDQFGNKTFVTHCQKVFYDLLDRASLLTCAEPLR